MYAVPVWQVVLGYMLAALLLYAAAAKSKPACSPRRGPSEAAGAHNAPRGGSHR